MRRESGGRSSRGWKIVCAVLLVAAMGCAAVACARSNQQDEQEEAFERLAQETNTKVDIPSVEITPTPGPSAEPTEAPPEKKDSREILQELGIPIPEKEVDFEDLRENVNADIYAWIYIPDTMIDYPVLQHPTDNTYYLNYNLDGSKGYPGCIYTEDYNTKDFSDPNTVVYGHNMKNGSMFAGLHKYGDSKFMEEHPYVYIYTEDALYAYEVFAAYEHTNEHILYAHNNFSSKALFKTYLDEIMLIRDMGSVIKEDVEYTEDSRILTLSTCISVKPNNRYLVQGVLLNGE